MKKTIFPIFLLGSVLCFAQEKYQVVYDYQTDRVNYLKIDKNNFVTDTLSKPKFKKNIPVEVKVLNVNPFAVDIVSKITEEDIHQQVDNSFNFTSLLGGITKFSGDKVPINIENLPVDETTFSRGDSKNSARGSAESYNKLSSNIDAIKSNLIANLTNPNLNKEQILANLKKISIEIVDGDFTTDPNGNYYLFLAELQNISDYVTLLSNDFATKTPTNTNEILSRGNDYKSFTSTAQNLSTSFSDTTSDINQIKELYSKLESSSFEKVYDYNIHSDKANIDLKFLESDFVKELEKGTEKTTVKERNIKLFSRGGFKINTSVALTLNNFSDKSKDFYIGDDGIIGADVNNNFVPNLSTMINFYPILGESVNVGGSFGISVPISDEIKGINFLIGPSLFFGSKSRMSLSGGIAYGPVQKLTNGLTEGQETTVSDLSNYVKNVYEIGYYFGVSFSLANIK